MIYNKILFLDIDGVVLPGRAYLLPQQTKPIVKVFDPCAVSLLNSACDKQDRKIVMHSSWIRTQYWDNYNPAGDVITHCVEQGINKELFHPDDPYCNRDISWRYDRVDEWVGRHPEVTDFLIVDDEPCAPDYQYKNHLVLTDFDEGITLAIYHKLLDGTRPL